MREENKCQLEVEPFFQCCCTCIFRMETAKRTEKEMIDKDGKYACCPPEFRVATLDWPEHSCGCEMHTPLRPHHKEKQPLENDNQGAK